MIWSVRWQRHRDDAGARRASDPVPPALVGFFNDPATTEIYTIAYTLSLHDALP
eukprot:COSAG02_NODE_35636_length_465_cov_1.371585_1_plen_53_part_10